MLSTLSRRWKRMRLRYIGTDGSLGYRTGRVYDLRVRRAPASVAVEIEIRRRWGGFCPYGSEAAFWRRWEPVAADKAEAE